MNDLLIKGSVYYIVAINILTFFVYFADKQRAKKGKWRIKEATLLTLALLGGSVGALAAMYTFRHKTQKLKFKLVWLFFILHIALAVCFTVIIH